MANLKQCLYCSRSFLPKREHGLYCTRTCRVKAHKAREKGVPAVGLPPSPGVESNHHPEIDPHFMPVAQMKHEIEQKERVIEMREKHLSDLTTLATRKEQRATQARHANFTERQIISESVSTLGSLIRNSVKQPQSTVSSGLGDNFSYFQTDLRLVSGLVGAGIGFIASKGEDTSERILTAVVGGGIGWVLGSLVNSFIPAQTQLAAPQYQYVPQLQAQANAPTAQKIVPASQLADLTFDTFNFNERMKKFIGEAEKGFLMTVSGLPKNGKSHFATTMAREFSAHGSVLYISAEEFLGTTIRERFTRMGATSSRIQVLPTRDINTILQHAPQFRFVIFDSITVISPKREQELLDTLKQIAPQTTLVAILQSNKDGTHAGSQSIIHASDVLVSVEKGVATARSRFNSSHETTWKIFPERGQIVSMNKSS